MVPTCKNVAPYSPTSLNVGTIVNAPLCNSLFLFLSFLCHPYILTIYVKKFIISSFCTFYSGQLSCSNTLSLNHRVLVQASYLISVILELKVWAST